jgi:hypothetical protein
LSSDPTISKGIKAPINPRLSLNSFDGIIQKGPISDNVAIEVAIVNILPDATNMSDLPLYQIQPEP